MKSHDNKKNKKKIQNYVKKSIIIIPRCLYLKLHSTFPKKGEKRSNFPPNKEAAHKKISKGLLQNRTNIKTPIRKRRSTSPRGFEYVINTDNDEIEQLEFGF